jgi:hypothetical protein
MASCGNADKKQNVFGDFIAAAEFLIHEGYTTPQNLAIRVGPMAAPGGRGDDPTPRLVRGGVCPAVGVMDMLRYQTSPAAGSGPRSTVRRRIRPRWGIFWLIRLCTTSNREPAIRRRW